MRVFLSCAATIAAILLVSQAAIAGELFPKVVVAPAPLKPYVDEILKGHGESQSLLRPGQEAHEVVLSPSQAQMLAQADVVIVPDLSMSPVLARMIAKNKRLKVIELTRLQGASPLPYMAENPWLSAQKEKAASHDEHAHQHEEHEEHAEHAATDPHLWLDPGRMAALAPALADAIATAVPEAKSTLAANAGELAHHLAREVMPPLRDMLKREVTVTTAVGKPVIPFITYHAAYQYFLAQFGLTYQGEITQRPEESMGAKTSATMQNAASTVRIRCLIGEVETPLMKRIAANSGARIILLSPEQLPERKDVDALEWMKNDYDRFLYTTAKAFAGCL